jgi:TATA-box binding protein (TBP) (component of TFIID and TFIIIB)
MLDSSKNDAIYMSELFIFQMLRMWNLGSKTVAMIYKSGRVVCFGAKSEEEVKLNSYSLTFIKILT